jgi:hypothetical protein
MLSEQEARLLADGFLADVAARLDQELAFQSTFDHGPVWIFGWNAKQFVDHPDKFWTALVGNGAIVVEKATAAVWMAHSNRPIDEQLVERNLL